MAIVTLRECEAVAVRRRVEALRSVRVHVADLERRYGGRFWLFGSAARGDVRGDSHIDLIADFPTEVEFKVFDEAERVCAETGVTCDIVEKRICSEEFPAIVSPDLRAILPQNLPQKARSRSSVSMSIENRRVLTIENRRPPVRAPASVNSSPSMSIRRCGPDGGAETRPQRAAHWGRREFPAFG